ncbi:MAG: PAS domain-containing sensor histidine kinase [Planctomycetes bacterium]|nr:PAS domain-containing sensor histidine kinase [Planctomycetota bacterium]MBI3836260.1 PAS domain-containing sensor histidine kinase [Planctomycetota bacterium]
MTTVPADKPISKSDFAYFREVCDQMGSGLIVADEDLRIRYWNRAAEGVISGVNGSLMQGIPVDSIIPEDRRKSFSRLVRAAMDSAQPGEFAISMPNFDGDPREFLSLICPLQAQQKESHWAILTFVDVTKRLAAGAEQQETRTMDALGEMSGAVAHHFNNILGGMVTALDFAEQSDDPQQTKKLIRHMSAALIRASALVNSLLAFSRGESRANDLCDLTELLNELADEVDRMIAGRNIEFQYTPPDLPVWSVPKLQLATILRNVVRNAVEAMLNGGRLTLQVIPSENGVQIAITDTGKGIDPHDRPRIFEPFWTTKSAIGDGSTTATGMGLAVAYGLAKVIGATISVESQANEGARFVITLPRPSPT